MTIGHCRNCNHWKRGTEVTFGPNFEEWSSELRHNVPSPRAGTTEFRWVHPDQKLGECRNASGEMPEIDEPQISAGRMFQAVADSPYHSAELVTNEGFGCMQFEPGTAAEQIDRVRCD
jgi:hypothetical protein